MTGRIHSIQSLGTVDGPGVRFVAFLQGCPLRCRCCHNPDTWNVTGGTEYTARDLVEKAIRFREYFGEQGGVTLSGGEPLLQAPFCREVFLRCREAGINTCLDTSGCIMNEDVSTLLDATNRVLLDVKYTNEEAYRENVGCGLAPILAFLDELDAKKIPTTLRQVIIPTLNDSDENIRILSEIANKYSCVDKAELLPFRKLCESKYQALGIPFPLSHVPEPTDAIMARLRGQLSKS